MIPELGSFSLILALCLSALLGSLPIAGAHYNNPVWISMARPLTAGVFVFLGLAISALAYAFITDDFSVSFVAQHSNTLLPMRYKFTAVCGSVYHEDLLIHGVEQIDVFTCCAVELPEDAIFTNGQQCRDCLDVSQNALEAHFHVNGLAGDVLKMPCQLARFRSKG